MDVLEDLTQSFIASLISQKSGKNMSAVGYLEPEMTFVMLLNNFSL